MPRLARYPAASERRVHAVRTIGPTFVPFGRSASSVRPK
jgi:hypothetical protein